MIKFIHNIWWLDMFLTSTVRSKEFFKLYVANLVCGNFTREHNIWTYRAVRKLPHTEFATYSLKNAPEDGPLSSETCRATKCYE